MRSCSSLPSRSGTLFHFLFNSVITQLFIRFNLEDGGDVFNKLQDKRAVERINIEKVYHPFLTGAYSKLVGELMQETGARINVPPPSVNKTEIVITGEKEQVALALVKIKKIYEEKVSKDRIINGLLLTFPNPQYAAETHWTAYPCEISNDKPESD